jgi:hypothetical protein
MSVQGGLYKNFKGPLNNKGTIKEILKPSVVVCPHLQ